VGSVWSCSRTLWEFNIEAFQTPGLGIILIAQIILLELILILILLLAHNGLLDLKFIYVGLGLELHQFATLVLKTGRLLAARRPFPGATRPGILCTKIFKINSGDFLSSSQSGIAISFDLPMC
jgi:hypothetical protein